MSGIDVEPEGGGFANEPPCLDDRVGLGDDTGQVGNLDGETSRLEVGGEDRLPGTTAEIELDLPGCREFHDVLFQLSSDRSDRNGDDDLPAGSRIDQVARIVGPNEDAPAARDQRQLSERASDVIKVALEVADRLAHGRQRDTRSEHPAHDAELDDVLE